MTTTAQTVAPKDPSRVRRGIEIFSRATEKLREIQVNDFKTWAEDFSEHAGLVDIMFLNDVMFAWSQARRNGTITSRCVFADVVLQVLGEDAGGQGIQWEEIELPRER